MQDASGETPAPQYSDAKVSPHAAPIVLSETYMHFDKLIWQVPSLGMAVGVGVIIAAGQIEKAPDGWALSLAELRAVVIALGALLLGALSAALFKYRIFLRAAEPATLPKPPFHEFPLASGWLQSGMVLTTFVLWGLVAVQVFAKKELLVPALVLGVIAAFMVEDRFRMVTSRLDRKVIDGDRRSGTDARQAHVAADADA